MPSRFFARKDLADLRSRADAEKGFRRTLGTLDVTALGVGFVIGTGIFVLTGHIAAQNAGPAVCLAFLLAAIPASLVALCYAEMVSTVPGVGGAYTYVCASLGALPGFLTGWTLTLTYCVGAATVATGWASYAATLLHDVTGVALPQVISASPWLVDDANHLQLTGGWINLPAAAIIMALSCVLLLGASASMRFTLLLVVLKVAVVTTFIIAAGIHVDPSRWHPFIPDNAGKFGRYGFSGLMQGASLAVFAYLGVDNLSTAVQEAKDPGRSIPRAIALTMGSCVTLYVLVCLVLTGVVSYRDLNVSDPIALGMRASHNGALEVLVQGGALAGLTSVLLIQLYGLPRILYAMAQDRLAPKWAAHLGAKHAAPGISTLAMGATCAVAAAFTPVELLAEVTAAGTLATFVCVSAGVGVLRHLHPRVKRRFKVPGGPYVVPVVAVLSCVALFVLAPWQVIATLVGWWLLGMGLFVIRTRNA